MASISVWTESNCDVADVFVVEQQELDKFLAVKDMYPHTITYVLSRNSKRYLELCCVYLAHKNQLGEEAIPDEFRNEKSSLFYSVLDRALCAFERDDLISFEIELKHIQADYSDDTEFNNAIFNLEQLMFAFNKIADGLVHNSPVSNSARRCWWRDTVEIVDNVSSAVAALSNICVVDSLKGEVINYLNIVKSVFVNYSNTNTSQKLKIISSYFFYISDSYAKRERYSISMLTIHRAIDLYFIHLALENNFIKEKRDFLIYHDDPRKYVSGSKPPSVYLHTTYFDYLASVHKLTNEQESDLKFINSKRNDLKYVHGIDYATKDDFTRARKGAHSIMRSDIEWSSTLRSLRFHGKIDRLNIFKDIFNIDRHVKLLEDFS